MQLKRHPRLNGFLEPPHFITKSIENFYLNKVFRHEKNILILQKIYQLI